MLPRMKKPMILLLALFTVLAVSCTSETTSTGTSADGVPEAVATPTPEPADEFLARLAMHCGQAFAGKITANEPAVENDPFEGKELVMHVRKCGEKEIEVPFHVGDDHSRTWVLTRTGEGLRLKHDHRHEDGTDDAVTMYGGNTSQPGTAARQEFPVDEFSKEMFKREDLDVSTTNTWAMEIEPNQKFVYELARPGRLFRVEFDLTKPVAIPPTPWGHEESEGNARTDL